MGSLGSLEDAQPPTITADSPSAVALTHQDVDSIIHSVREASSADIGSPYNDNPPAELHGEVDGESASYYWDVSTMAPLNPASAAAIARLRAFKPPPFPLWDRLPVSRRAAVLLLLYADRRGDLRVVITMRAASLRSFSGHAALPGGKADTPSETPYQIARREAWEEIGLPMDDSKLPAPFRIEHLCYLPFNLAKTELVVRPCVALLHTADPPVPTSSITPSHSSPSQTTPTAEETLIPRLDAKEVAAVFSAPFHNFLRETDELPPPSRDMAEEEEAANLPLPPGKWYEGAWTHWHSRPWRMHFFHVPVSAQHVAKPRVRAGGLAALSEDGDGSPPGSEDDPGRYKVWGMTARILVDAATIAYGEGPEFEHNGHFGDEEIIDALDGMGRLGEKKMGAGVVEREIGKEEMARVGEGVRKVVAMEGRKGGDGGAKM